MHSTSCVRFLDEVFDIQDTSSCANHPLPNPTHVGRMRRVEEPGDTLPIKEVSNWCVLDVDDVDLQVVRTADEVSSTVGAKLRHLSSESYKPA